MKKRGILKNIRAQKISDKKRGILKNCKRLKRPLIKKEASLKKLRVNIHIKQRRLRFKRK
jgi:hypothetical protein